MGRKNAVEKKKKKKKGKEGGEEDKKQDLFGKRQKWRKRNGNSSGRQTEKNWGGGSW